MVKDGQYTNSWPAVKSSLFDIRNSKFEYIKNIRWELFRPLIPNNNPMKINLIFSITRDLDDQLSTTWSHRDDKLTLILKECLNSMLAWCYIVANISDSSSDHKETLSICQLMNRIQHSRSCHTNSRRMSKRLLNHSFSKYTFH